MIWSAKSKRKRFEYSSWNCAKCSLVEWYFQLLYRISIQRVLENAVGRIFWNFNAGKNDYGNNWELLTYEMQWIWKLIDFKHAILYIQTKAAAQFHLFLVFKIMIAWNFLFKYTDSMGLALHDKCQFKHRKYWRRQRQ